MRRLVFAVWALATRCLINPGIVFLCFHCDEVRWFWHRHPQAAYWRDAMTVTYQDKP